MRKHLVRAMAIGAGLALIVAASAFAKPQVIRAGNLFLRDNGGISPSQAAQAQPGADLGPHRRRNRDHRRQPSPRGQDPRHRLRQEHSGERQGPARLQAGPARSAHRPRPRRRPAPMRSSAPAKAKSKSPSPNRRRSPPRARSSSSTAASTAAPRSSSSTPTSPSRRRPPSSSRSRSPASTAATTASTPSSQIPSIAGGAGSVTKFKLTIDRRFTYKGKKESYLTASCPTGRLLHRRARSSSPTAARCREPTSCPARRGVSRRTIEPYTAFVRPLLV